MSKKLDTSTYPSAQLWFKKFTEKDRKAFRKAVGENWDEYEEKMKQHWPTHAVVKKEIKHRTRKQR